MNVDYPISSWIYRKSLIPNIQKPSCLISSKSDKSDPEIRNPKSSSKFIIAWVFKIVKGSGLNEDELKVTKSESSL